MRTNWLIAATLADAKTVQHSHPQYRTHLVLTPRSADRCRGFQVGEYVWTPQASALPARTRLAIKMAMAPAIDEKSREEAFPSMLTSR